MLNTETLLSRFNPLSGETPGAAIVKRHLHDLRGCFADVAAFDAAAAAGNPLLYQVASVEPAAGAGDLHNGIGLLMTGKIGDEYFMTKGHLHSWREAAECYIGVYPAKAGHDYSTIAKKNFRCVVVERNSLPAMLTREEFLTPPETQRHEAPE